MYENPAVPSKYATHLHASCVTLVQSHTLDDMRSFTPAKWENLSIILQPHTVVKMDSAHLFDPPPPPLNDNNVMHFWSGAIIWRLCQQSRRLILKL